METDRGTDDRTPLRSTPERRAPPRLDAAQAFARVASRMGALVGIGIGLVYLVAWRLGLPPRWAAHGVIVMKTNMALGQILTGSALLLLATLRSVPAAARAARIAAGAVLAIGLLTLAEYAFGVDLRIDQLLATEPLAVGQTIAPNRMGLPGATSLTMLGAGLLALSWRRSVYLWLGVATSGVVLFPAVGFVYGIGPLYTNAHVTVIAWPTVVALLALGLGLALSDPDDGSVPLLWRRDDGGHLLRRMIAPAILLPLAIGFVRILGERRGLYERFLGTGLFAVSMSMLCLLLIWRGAARVSASAVQRDRVEYQARLLFTRMTEGVAVGEALLDEHGNPQDFRFLEMNDAFEHQTGLSRSAVQGRPFRTVLPHLEQRWIDTYCGVALTGEAVRFEQFNRDTGRLYSVYCFCPEPGRFAILFSDVTERERASAELRHEAELLDLGDAFVELDPAFRIVRVNAAYERLSRRTRAELLGRSHWEVFPATADPASAYWREYHRAMRDRVPVAFDERYAPLDMWTGVTVYPTSTGGLAIFVRDATRRKRAEEELRAANDRLVEADRRKDEFLGMLSHELRNPLAPIRNALFVLNRADPSSPQALRARAIAARQFDHLTRLVDDLLDVTRIARGKIQLRLAVVDVAGIASHVAEDLRSLFLERGVVLEVHAPGAPLRVHGDETRLAQIVGNLLHNAAKFTPAGGRVVVTAAPEDGWAVLRIRDTGAGIQPELLDRIFDPFTQAQQTLARSEGGLGLGLALVKGLVELHGGSVAVVSEGPERGSEFTIRVPLAPAAAVEASSQARSRSDARRGKRRVLVVDDNRDAAESLAELVRMFGHEVEVAFDGTTALDKAAAVHPQVVLCDIGLPGMSGYEVARALRSRGDHLVRLVAVSGYAQPDDVRRAAEAGFDDHVPKPADPARIERLLRAAESGAWGG